MSGKDQPAATLVAGKEAEVQASFARQGLMQGIGAVLTKLGPGRCRIELPFSDLVGQQQGFFHGGIIGAVADTAGGSAERVTP